jgi:flagellar biosynthesis GTPase FlhF
MADVEVENTLREIRERVLADARLRAPVAAAAANGGPAGRAGNGASDGGAWPQAGASGEALARLDANLATTARAWSRLPPILTYRSGAAARLELWLKRLVKRAAHWFTWEQVNFNSAVNHALGDVRAALGELRTSLAETRAALATEEQAHARTREELREEFLAEMRAGRAEAESGRARLAELQARLAHAEARSDAGVAGLRQALAAALERLAEEQRAAAAEASAAQRTSAEEIRREQSGQVEARAAELHEEIRRRADALLEEQRVCFKQLSLEASEAAVTHDRARRQLEARLEALEKTVNREP